MGCTMIKKQDKKDQPPTPITVAGVLTVTITNAVFFHQASMFKMDPYLKLTLSNQQKTSKVVQKGGKKPHFNEQFKFIINSCYKIYGRNLEIHAMDHKKIGADNFIGYGIVDLNPVINFSKDGKDNNKLNDCFRCMLNFQYREAGFVNICAKFEEEPTELISFRFEQAVIRRKTSTFGDMNCWVQLTVGEEVMKTRKHRDTRSTPPNWQTQIFTIKTLIHSIKNCTIKVMDDDIEIGQLNMEMQKLLGKEGQQSFIQDFVFDEGIYGGTIKFQTIKGPNPVFSKLQPHRTSVERKLLQIIQQQNKHKQKQKQNKQNYFSSKEETANPYNQKVTAK